MRNAFPFFAPAERRGRDTAAPSGKFCSPMPTARAMAPASAPASVLCAAAANASPTAMPSGMLCNVTASTSMVDF